MRNHDEKARDMARSILASTGRKGARYERARIHRLERLRWRAELSVLRQYDDPDDFEGDLTWRAKSELAEMVWRRREGDKLGPLRRWAFRHVDVDPYLRDAAHDERVVWFGTVFPGGMDGGHALAHVEDELRFRGRMARGPGARRGGGSSSRWEADQALVRAILAAGEHGALNRHLRARLTWTTEIVRVPARRVVTRWAPEPGFLVRAHTERRRVRQSVRYLAGAHDVEAFARERSEMAEARLFAEARGIRPR